MVWTFEDGWWLEAQRSHTPVLSERPVEKEEKNAHTPRVNVLGRSGFCVDRGASGAWTSLGTPEKGRKSINASTPVPFPIQSPSGLRQHGSLGLRGTSGGWDHRQSEVKVAG